MIINNRNRRTVFWASVKQLIYSRPGMVHRFIMNLMYLPSPLSFALLILNISTPYIHICRSSRNIGQAGFDYEIYHYPIIFSFVGLAVTYYPYHSMYCVQYRSHVGHLSTQLHSLFNVRSNAMIPPAVSLGTAISWSSRAISRPSLLFWINV